MTKQGFTYLCLIVDRSGSMDNIKSDMEGALSTFIADQKQVPGECQVMFVQFDDEITTVFAHRDIQTIDKIEIHPRNMTAMLDAIGTTVNTLGTHFIGLAEEERPDKVLLVIVTDGLENASKEFTHEQVKALLDEQQSKWSWGVTYLGANQNAVNVGRGLGVASAMTYAPTAGSTQTVGRSLSSATTRYRGSSGSSFGYNDAEEEAVAQTVTPPPAN